MPPLPIALPILFMVTTAITVWFFHRAIQVTPFTATRSLAGRYLLFAVAWLIIQAILGLTGFYLETKAMPPRFIFAIGPPTLALIALFIFAKQFTERISAETLTYLHIVRIPVEIGLWWLASKKLIPEVMTFEGRNFDILAGLTAPLIGYFGYTQVRLSKPVVLVWNILCILLLLNIVSHGILSAPTPLQMMSFEQPNVGVFYFPFIWLPAFIVPTVLCSHLICIRQIFR